MNNHKVKDQIIIFKDFPYFRPNLRPEDIFALGSFGGTYWRPIYSDITRKSYKDQHKEFAWANKIDTSLLTRDKEDVKLNNYQVNSGTSLQYWQEKGWIKAQDPYGWVQWYCRFYAGRRSVDDERQINRWLKFTGPKGRFKKRLLKMIVNNKTTFNDYKISPVIRQGLQHWGYRITKDDVIQYKKMHD